MQYPQANDELKEQVRRVMQYHVGYLHRIDRDDLTARIFGEVTDNYDRKIRDALSDLPVVHDGGYFVPLNHREADGYIAGMKSRMAAIAQKIRIIQDHLRREAEPVQVEQMQLLEA